MKSPNYGQKKTNPLLIQKKMIDLINARSKYQRKNQDKNLGKMDDIKKNAKHTFKKIN